MMRCGVFCKPSQAKARLDLHRKRTVDLMAVQRTVNPPSARERIDAIASKTLTLVRNDNEIVPLSSAEPPDVLLVDYLFARDRASDPDVLAEELQKRARRVRRVRLTPRTVDTMAERIVPEPGEVVVVASYAQKRSLLGPGERAEALTEALAELARRGTRVIFVSLGTPYALSELSGQPRSSRPMILRRRRSAHSRGRSSGKSQSTVGFRFVCPRGILKDTAFAPMRTL